MCAYFSTALRFVFALIIPPVVSTALYWLPNLARLQDAELRAWFLLFFTIWFVPSVAASLLTAGVVSWIEHRNRKKLRSEANQQ
ncbi:MAG: hypothetical protein DLM73_07805 [Chthoniobacterales bacterium]|nr:MAG: hypothetical protein DLM73_07805 [Chthoniobacterales bacterium]